MNARNLIALGIAAAALGASGPAAAADNQPVDANGKKSCALKTSKDGTMWLPHGTTITGTTPQGNEFKATCDDGVWKTERAAPSVSITESATFSALGYGVVTLQLRA